MSGDEDTAAQSALSGWGADESDDTEEDTDADSGQTDGSQRERDTDHSHRGRSVFEDPSISDDASLSDYSCPWCLHPADDFTVRRNSDDDVIGELPMDPQISCGNCSAVIPVHAAWYKRGEKICIPV